MSDLDAHTKQRNVGTLRCKQQTFGKKLKFPSVQMCNPQCNLSIGKKNVPKEKYQNKTYLCRWKNSESHSSHLVKNKNDNNSPY